MSFRFLLILSTHSNLLRAALVTRELRIVASAHQPFQIKADEFDPAEVWYKAKQVIAACLDIGRTQSREIAAIAIVTDSSTAVMWHQARGDVTVRGLVSRDAPSPPLPLPDSSSFADESWQHGTMGNWLLWNLSGATEIGSRDFPKTCARSPFDGEIPILSQLNETKALEIGRNLDCPEPDCAILGAARRTWEKIV